MRIAIVSNTSWYLFNFRLNLMHVLAAAGHSVVAVAPRDDYSAKIEAHGFEFVPVKLSGTGMNPLLELASVVSFFSVFRRHKVDLVFSYTPKGTLYSALACIACRAKFVPNVSGLGRAFTERSIATHVAWLLYRLTFKRAHLVFFENADDLGTFVNAGLVMPARAMRLPGAGVDLQHFSAPQNVDPNKADVPVFLLVARMLWDKGVGDFVTAARLVRAHYPQARFQLLGFLGVDNPSAISREQIAEWVTEGVVDYLGATDDVRGHMARADCVVLPSYREGLPRSLLEAAAMALPLVTTDATGCRDTVVDGVTGLLCRPRDPQDLARKLLVIAEMSGPARRAMGLLGRAHMEANFSEQVVLQHYLQCVGDVAGVPPI